MAKALQHERKKQRQAAPRWEYGSAEWNCELAKWGNEREFLIDVLRPHHSAIAKALVPIEADLVYGDPEEEIKYAIDLIRDAVNAEGDDPIAATINNVYRDEAALAHIERAVRWRIDNDWSQPTAACVPEAASVGLVLKTNNKVIGIPHNDHIALGLVLPPAVGPKVEHVVHVDVGEQGHAKCGAPKARAER